MRNATHKYHFSLKLFHSNESKIDERVLNINRENARRTNHEEKEEREKEQKTYSVFWISFFFFPRSNSNFGLTSTNQANIICVPRKITHNRVLQICMTTVQNIPSRWNIKWFMFFNAIETIIDKTAKAEYFCGDDVKYLLFIIWTTTGESEIERDRKRKKMCARPIH